MDNSWSSSENSESESKPETNAKEKNENNLKNISPFMSKDLIAVAGFNVETPIVSAIIGNLTGTLPTRKSETEMIKCDICHLDLPSSIIFDDHLRGSKHKKRIKALEILNNLKDAKDKGVQLGDSENPNVFKCEICSLSVNSPIQLQIHLTGAKHRKNIAKAECELEESTKTSETTEKTDYSSPPAAKKRKKDEPSLIPCDICNIFMNSPRQYDQHLLSKKHQNRTSGICSQRRIFGRGKFTKFPEFKSGEIQFPTDSPNQKESKPLNRQICNRLISHSTSATKNPYYKSYRNGENNMNLIRQSAVSRSQNKF